MLAPIPYFDVAGYKRRCKVAPQDVDLLVALYPGYLEHRIARGSSWTNARLQKRYIVPLGQGAPQPVAVGTNPPALSFTGRPTLGSLEMVVEILTAGALGVSTFWWSADGGETWTFSPLLAASGTSPPPATISGTGALADPSALVLEVTTGGALGAARYQWSQDRGNTWTLGALMASSGTTPPAVTLSGTSNLAAPSDVQIQIITAGGVGAAVFQWSQDGGATWTTGLTTSLQPIPLGATGLFAAFAAGNYATNNAYVGQGAPTSSAAVLGATGLAVAFPAGTYATDNVFTGQGLITAPSVVLGSTGLAAAFSASGSYSGDNFYESATPVPEVALGWLVAMLDVDVWDRRGRNPQDPAIVDARADRDTALAEIKEAADSVEGLFELPTNDAVGDSAVDHAGPLTYSESSPFVAADLQEHYGRCEDEHRRGTQRGR